MKHYLNLSFFLLIISLLIIPSSQFAFASEAPTYQATFGDNDEASTTCILDGADTVNVQASTNFIIVTVITDDSDGIAVTDEDLQTYTLQTDSTSGGSGSEYTYIYTTVNPTENSSNDITVTIDSGDVICFAQTFSGVNTSSPIGDADSVKTTAGDDDITTFTTTFDNAIIVQVCGNVNTSVFTGGGSMDEGSTVRASESNGGANKFAGAVSTEATTTAGADDQFCDPSKAGDMSHSVVEVKGAPAPAYVVDLLDVYESASTTLDSGTAVCLDVDLETADECQGITTASFVDTTSVSTDATNPEDVDFSITGDKMFVLDGNDDIEEYSCSGAWDVSSCTHTDNLNVNAQEATPVAFTFSTDGTKLFVVGATGQDVNEYDCTAFDVSTCSFVDALDISAQSTDPDGIDFSNDGTKMFVLDDGTVDEINEYECSSFDVSTCVFVDSLDFSVETTAGADVIFDKTGKRFWITQDNGGQIREWICSVEWDISSCTPNGFILISEVANGDGVVFSHDMKKMIVSDFTNSDITEYDLNAPLKVNVSYRFEVEVDNTGDLAGSPDQMTVFGSVGSPFDTSALTETDELDIGAQDLNAVGMKWNDDGTTLIVFSGADEALDQYTCDSFDVSSCSFDDTTSVSTNTQHLFGGVFTPDGLTVFLLDNDLSLKEEIDEYTCSTSFDASTCTTFVGSTDIGAVSSSPKDILFNPSGSKMWIVQDDTTDRIKEYLCPTVFDALTCVFSNELDVNGDETDPVGVVWNDDGTRFYLLGKAGNDTVHQYDCTVSYTVESCTLDNSNDINATSSTQSISISSDGTKLYISDSFDETIKEHKIGGLFGGITASDISSSGCGTQINWVDSISGGSDILLVDGTTCSISVSGSVEFWFIVTLGADAFNDDITFEITDGTLTDTSTVTSFDVTRPIYHFNELDVYESASTTLDSGTAICTDRSLTSGYCTGWDFEGFTFNDVSSPISLTSLEAIRYSTDGLLLFMMDTGTDDIFELNCTTAFDTSTCSDASSTFDYSGTQTSAVSFDWKPDGTKLFIASTADVAEYNCTAWDVSTCSHVDDTATSSFSITNLDDIIWTPDGFTLIVIDQTPETIEDLQCTSAWDMSSCSAGITSLDVTSEDTLPEGVGFATDGSRFIVYGDENDNLYIYDCVINWNLDTCSFIETIDISTETSLARGLEISPDGTRLFTASVLSDEINEWDLSILTEGSTYRIEVDIFNLGGFTSSPDIFSMLSSVGGLVDAKSAVLKTTRDISSVVTSLKEVIWNDDGTKMYTLDGSTLSEDVEEWDCVIKYEVGACTDTVSPLSINTQSDNPIGFSWNDDGTKIFIINEVSDDIDEYGSCTAYDVSTCSYTDTYTVTDINTAKGMDWNNDGTKLYVGETLGNEEIHEYSCTAFDVSTCSHTDFLDVETNSSVLRDMAFSSDGLLMLVADDQTTPEIDKYTCSTAFDVSTCSYVTSSTLVLDISVYTTLHGIAIDDNDSKFYLGGTVSGEDNIQQWEMGNVFGSITASDIASSGCSTNTNWTDSIVNDIDVQLDSGTTCSLALGGSATYWFIVTLDNDTPPIDLANFKIDDGITAYESPSMSFSVKEGAGTIDHTKNIVDNLSMIDSQTYARLLNIADPMGIVDSVAATRIIINTESDQLSLTDLVTNTITRINTESDPLSITDSVTFTKMVINSESDNLSITDSVSRIASYTDTESDDLSITDSVTTTVVIVNSESDDLSITDSVSRIASYTNTESDDLSITDSVTFHIIEIQSDQFSITDNVFFTRTIINLESDQLSITDNVTFIRIITNTELDNLSITDSVSRIASYTDTESDDLSITDSVTSLITKGFSDQLSITDSVIFSVIASRSISDDLSITDSVSFIRTITNTESDDLSITDSVSRIASYTNTESDDLSITDSVTTTVVIVNSESDDLSITDNVSRIVSYTNTESDDLSITDSVTTTVVIINSETDPLSITDSVIFSVIASRSISDDLSITDNVSFIRTITNTESDDLSITDSVSRIVSYTNTESDDLSITDSVTSHVTKIITNPLSITDNITADCTGCGDFLNSESDDLSITDSVTSHTTKTITEPLSITDNVSFTRTIINTEIDQLSITDSITAIRTIINTESDDLSITDSVTSHVTKTITEPLSITDNITTTRTIINTETDQLSITDLQTSHVTKFPSDPLSITDSITLTKMVINSESNDLSITDSVSFVRTIINPESDDLSITDSITTTVVIVNSESDDLSITDNVSRIASYTDTESDDLSITDVITFHTTKGFADQLSITDSITADCTGCGDFLNSESDDLSITDSVTATIMLINTESDNLSIIDNISQITTRNIGFVEEVDVGDDGDITGVDRSNSESDPLSIIDSVTTILTVFFNIIDNLSVTDIITATNSTGIHFINATETVNVNDLVTDVGILVYDPTGKVIWFKVADPTNSTKGGVFEFDCDTTEIVVGVNGTGYVKCTNLHAPTTTQRGGIFEQVCPGGEYVSGIDSNGDLICTALP